MSGFVCPHCGEHVDIFPASPEYRALLDELPLLGAIPLDPATAMSGDKGQPVVVRMPGSTVAEAFGCIAEKVADVLRMEKTETDMQMPGIGDESSASKEERFDAGRGLEGGSS
jgi:hypothetical protein